MTQTGQFTENFCRWAHKTSELNDAAWARGFYALEHRVREAARIGENIWPPSYPAFLGMCDEPPDPHGKALYKFVTPYFVVKQLESDEAKEKARIAAERELDKMKSLFE